VTTIEQVIARIDAWRGRPVAVSPLPHGLTNQNYRVDVGDESFVVRIPGESTELLQVDRANELYNTRVAAEVGVGARLVHHLPDLQVMIIEFIRGRTLSMSDLRAEGMPARIAAVLRRLHGGPRFQRDFDMLALADHYLAVAGDRGIPIPADYRDRLPAIRRLGAALAARPLPTVPCHNDLLPENYLDDGDRLRVVDWEYSGNNDPAFELGNTCQELLYDEPRIEELCRAYFGEARPELVARVTLNMILSDVGWTLWAAIQATISRIDFDFRSYGANRWARATAKLAGPDFPRWLEAVRLERMPGRKPG
jgi:thiamine kinase-like enzyme